MLGMKNHFDISGSIEIREVDIAGVACTFMGISLLNSCIFWSFQNGKARKMALTSLDVYTTSHPLHQTSLNFAPLATGPNFGSSIAIGLLKGQSDVTLSGMLLDPNNAVNSLDLILIWDEHIIAIAVGGGGVMSQDFTLAQGEPVHALCN